MTSLSITTPPSFPGNSKVSPTLGSGTMVSRPHQDHVPTIDAGLFLVTEPGMTPLRPWQVLSEEDLQEAEDQFGPSTFAAQSLGDIVDDWLTESIARLQPEESLTRLIVLNTLFEVGEEQAEDRPRGDDAAAADFYRQATLRLSRLDKMRVSGAPDILRNNERRLLGLVVRDLVASAAATNSPRASFDA